MLESVIFDLDGVLIDSEPLMRLAFAASYEQVVGRGRPPIEAYLEHMGKPFPQIMDELGLPRALWQPFREFSRCHIRDIKFYDEAVTLLHQLHNLGLKMGIVTGKDSERTLEILDHFAIKHFFSAVVASDHLQNPKPHPEGIQVALRILQCRPEDAVFIGDSVDDIHCGQQANVTSIAVTWGIKPERVQSLCTPDFVVHSWQFLSKVLLDLRKQPATGVYKSA